LSPYAGTLEEGKEVSLDSLKRHYEEMLKRYDFIVVEGAGGVAVPIKRDYNYAHLARDWSLKTLLVARAGLGTINHSFLSWYYMKSMDVEPIAIVMNGFEGKDVSERTNPTIVKELTGLKVVQIPKIEGLLLPSNYRDLLAELVGF
ncbi:MAG: dethiobiotin synthase, partial [Hydrogenothermaceae bacterium]|nr:dethiobiotin synthase [Hydrogenothermaceae bacterium]